MNNFNKDIIKFYAGDNPEMFEIERRCMDRDGRVIEFLNKHLPHGLILDVGAGNGFTAEKLTTEGRLVIPMEPDEKIIDPQKELVWIKGVAQHLPFHDKVFNGAYSTWAFYFPSMGTEQVKEGLNELKRVIKKGGTILIVDNAGDDEFSALADKNIGNFESDNKFWDSVGFTHTIIDTSFRFDNIDEARKLLGFYFGEKGKQINKTEFQYRVVVYEGTAT